MRTKRDESSSLTVMVANVSSSREVIGGGDIRLIALMHVLSKLKTWNLVILSDKYYVESLIKRARSNGLSISSNISCTLLFPRYLPPYKKGYMVLRYVMIMLSTLLHIIRKKVVKPLAIIWGNQVYNYVIWGIEPLIEGLIVYIQAPPLRNTFRSFLYTSLLALLKVLSCIKKVVVFVLNPVDYVIMKHLFKNNHNIKVVLTRNGIFLDIVKEVLRTPHTIKYDLIYVGRLDEKKGAFQNFILLLHKLSMLGVKLRIAVITSCLKEELQGIVASALKSIEGHEINVFINLPIKKVYEIYAESKVLVVLSKLDVFNNTILEALSMGSDVIVLKNPRIKSAYELIMRFLPESISKRIHFVKDVDEAVSIIIDLLKKDRRSEGSAIDKDLPHLIDWRYIVLRELLTVIRWLYRE